jgi:hypothetical protein
MRKQSQLLLAATDGPERHRRGNPRHTPLECGAWLAWERDRSTLRVPARLLDVSRGGAAAELDAEVAPNQCLLFGLDGWPIKELLVEATVVHVATLESGGYRVHLAFTKPCPDALLKQALFGTRGARRYPSVTALLSILRSFTGRWASKTKPA